MRPFRGIALKNENAQAQNHRIHLPYRSNNIKFREKQGQHLLLNVHINNTNKNKNHDNK